MKIGEIINGYEVAGVDGAPFSNKNAGCSTWTFVRKRGIYYFMKEFLAPTFPIIGSPGSETKKIKKRALCLEFEKQHHALKETIDPCVIFDTHLVQTLDFFRVNAKYYKVTRKINSASLSIAEISRLPLEKRTFILRVISESLKILHDAGIVHGDIKPQNILFEKDPAGFFVPYLIDYDNGYFYHNPPQAENIIGDLTYFSPEVEKYVQTGSGIATSEISLKSDIFSLGIVFCQILSGEYPEGVSSDKYASNVVNNGGKIVVKNAHRFPDTLVTLINTMLSKDPVKRPTVKTIIATINTEKSIVKRGNLTINMRFKKDNP